MWRWIKENLLIFIREDLERNVILFEKFFFLNFPNPTSPRCMINKIIASSSDHFSREIRINANPPRFFPRLPLSFSSWQTMSRALIALLFFIYRSREKGANEGGGEGRGGWAAAFTSDKIPANLSTLQPQRQNSSVEIGDRGEPVMEGGA